MTARALVGQSEPTRTASGPRAAAALPACDEQEEQEEQEEDNVVADFLAGL